MVNDVKCFWKCICLIKILIYKEYGVFCIDIKYFVLKLYDLNIYCILIKLNGLCRVIYMMVMVIKFVKSSVFVFMGKLVIVKR